MIKSWIFEFFGAPPELAQHFDPAASQRHFNAYLDLWTSAECAGFDGIFFSEHHFGAGYSPAPHLLNCQRGAAHHASVSRRHGSSTKHWQRRHFASTAATGISTTCVSRRAPSGSPGRRAG